MPSKAAKTVTPKAPTSSKDYQVDLSPEAKAKPVPATGEAGPVAVTEKKSAEPTEQVNQIKAEKAGTIRRPAIIFVTGWQGMLSPSESAGSYAGVGQMAESVLGGRLYDWDQKSEILDHIKKTHVDQPIILVGHSLGGDTVKEVSDELNTLEHNFRTVDLLVTMDAVGFGNDIIGQNVRQHLNIFGENDMFLNDGPHVARQRDKTKVSNVLSALDHTALDDAHDIQYEIIQAINRAIVGRQPEGPSRT